MATVYPSVRSVDTVAAVPFIACFDTVSGSCLKNTVVVGKRWRGTWISTTIRTAKKDITFNGE